ncbi:hypothetical protein SLINC_7828 [Streptomyces lincolnensis]|uniref:Uncharacterized protein n=1 Tax=Streptomyces lincolnensis TaxID=1915 RepID=A0A1B1MNT4_STRLN|nr:hypothetical protein SLINC_7828 [Streptomyces lincolnensis]AXG58949.1 hypothetical protein SLCG_7794 [Streptomyces lincolnensis]
MGDQPAAPFLAQAEGQPQPQGGVRGEFLRGGAAHQCVGVGDVGAGRDVEGVDVEAGALGLPREEGRPGGTVGGEAADAVVGRWHVEHHEVLGVVGEDTRQVAAVDGCGPLGDQCADLCLVGRCVGHGLGSLLPRVKGASPTCGHRLGAGWHTRSVPPTFDDLLIRARSLAPDGRRAVLGIAGSPGAGKTTLAERLVRALNADGEPWVAHVPMDGFHLADVELERLGLRDRKGAPQTFDAFGYAALLRRLRVQGDDEVVYAPGFERVLEQPIAGAIAVSPSARLVVTEGNYLLLGTGAWGRVRAEVDEVWFCEIDEEERLRRLVARHVAFGKSYEEAVAWVRRSDQRNAELVAASRGRADLVVCEDAL